MFSGIDIFFKIFSKVLSVPQNIVMDLDNVKFDGPYDSYPKKEDRRNQNITSIFLCTYETPINIALDIEYGL